MSSLQPRRSSLRALIALTALTALTPLTAVGALGLAACAPDLTLPPIVDAPPTPPLIFDAYRATADSGFGACASATYRGEQDPAALLVVLDRSSSMSEGNKWTFAAQAIVRALDQDVFDTMHVGLYAAPSGDVTGPACIFGLEVPCFAPPFPQVDLTLAGGEKSNAPTGVRREIRNWLGANGPFLGIGDASPMYNALQSSLGSLQSWPEDGKRILLVVSDGTLSCNQLSSPTRPGFADCNGCTHDWEDPRNLATLLGAANLNPATPISSFIVGVPGADTYDPSGCNYPPSYMRNALSTIAAAGAPDFIPADCDGRTFSPPGANPARSCHFDMTISFSADELAAAIAAIRGQTVGCIYDLPTPIPPATIDLAFVNVEYVVDSTPATMIPRRADPTNPCTTSGCWDYTPDNRVELIGKACDDVTGGASVEVKIVVGCATVIE